MGDSSAAAAVAESIYHGVVTTATKDWFVGGIGGGGIYFPRRDGDGDEGVPSAVAAAVGGGRGFRGVVLLSASSRRGGVCGILWESLRTLGGGGVCVGVGVAAAAGVVAAISAAA